MRIHTLEIQTLVMLFSLMAACSGEKSSFSNPPSAHEERFRVASGTSLAGTVFEWNFVYVGTFTHPSTHGLTLAALEFLSDNERGMYNMVVDTTTATGLEKAFSDSLHDTMQVLGVRSNRSVWSRAGNLVKGDVVRIRFSARQHVLNYMPVYVPLSVRKIGHLSRPHRQKAREMVPAPDMSAYDNAENIFRYRPEEGKVYVDKSSPVFNALYQKSFFLGLGDGHFMMMSYLQYIMGGRSTFTVAVAGGPRSGYPTKEQYPNFSPEEVESFIRQVIRNTGENAQKVWDEAGPIVSGDILRIEIHDELSIAKRPAANHDDARFRSKYCIPKRINKIGHVGVRETSTAEQSGVMPASASPGR